MNINHTIQDDLAALGFSKEEIETISKKIFESVPENITKESELVEHVIIKLKELEFDVKNSEPSRYELLLFLLGMMLGMTTQMKIQEKSLFDNFMKFLKNSDKE